MDSVFIVGFAATIAGLFAISSLRLPVTHLSDFELNRRAKQKDDDALLMLRRASIRNHLELLQQVIFVLFIVAMTAFSTILFGYFVGGLVVIAIASVFRVTNHSHKIQKLVGGWYLRVEPKLLDIIEPRKKLLPIPSHVTKNDYALSSREELIHVISARGVLTADEKKHILHGLSFNERRVSDITTPLDELATIAADEVLGPLVVHDLYATRRSQFPVYDTSTEAIIGSIYLRQLLHIDSTAKTHTAREIMDKQVAYVREDEPLGRALTAFLRTHQSMLVVINKQRETVGVAMLTDCMQALFGRSLKDSFDGDTDLQAVATRK